MDEIKLIVDRITNFREPHTQDKARLELFLRDVEPGLRRTVTQAATARLSERRFGMLVEGPLTPEEAAQAGPRVVARGLMPFRNKPIEWVAQLRVAQAVVPLDGTDAAALLEQMGELLAAVPADSRRAVFPLHEEPVPQVPIQRDTHP